MAIHDQGIKPKSSRLQTPFTYQLTSWNCEGHIDFQTFILSKFGGIIREALCAHLQGLAQTTNKGPQTTTEQHFAWQHVGDQLPSTMIAWSLPSWLQSAWLWSCSSLHSQLEVCVVLFLMEIEEALKWHWTSCVWSSALTWVDTSLDGPCSILACFIPVGATWTPSLWICCSWVCLLETGHMHLSMQNALHVCLHSDKCRWHKHLWNHTQQHP